MIKGFKEFITRGNVIELAVGVIIAGAFNPIVQSITDVIMGFIAAIFGQPNFDSVGQFTLNNAVIMPGAIITALVNFLMVAFAIYFFVVVPMNKLAPKKVEEAAPDEDIALLTEIRDLLKANQQN